MIAGRQNGTTTLANVGCAWVSTLDQDFSLQFDAPTAAGYAKVLEDCASDDRQEYWVEAIL